MNADEALTRLGESTADAVAGVLARLAPDSVRRGPVAISTAGADPLAGIETPAVATSVSYVDGVTGGNVFVVTVATCRRLAAAMTGAEAPADADGELSELELSAASEAMNQMMAAAAGATGAVLGQDIQIDPPETRLVAAPADLEGLYPATPHSTIASFSVFGEPCRLLQLVPNAFVVRMSRALGEQSGTPLGSQGGEAGTFGGELLRDVGLRVWAELGRARLPVGRAVGLAPGAVLELDRTADEPVDLYVNGHRFACGRLLVDDDGEWTVQIESIVPAVAAGARGGA